MLAKLRNGGEACTAANRFYVEASVADRFAEKLAAKMGAMTMGRGDDDGVQLGPLVTEATVEKVDRLAKDAISGGARALVGGQRPGGNGFFYPATVLVDVPEDADCLTEEIFGPVAPIVTFTTEAEAVRRATTLPSAWSPTSTPVTSVADCGSANGWNAAWSASIAA